MQIGKQFSIWYRDKAKVAPLKRGLRLMEIKDILKQSREIWNFKMKLPEIVIAMGKVFGDICRWARNAKKDAATHTNEELKKELGNMIVSTVRWCDDLGYNPEECVERALEAQREFPKD